MAAAPSRFPGILLSHVEFTSTVLGRGADATVYAVEWKGTLCAAKRLHDALLEDEAPGGVDMLIRNFERECLTWSKLRHPAVVQFLGVYLEPRTRLPVLVLEKMDTSLRKYLENERKDYFPLNLKAFVLRQISQALAYLHNQDPSLVHHDLSTNNVLLNKVSFVTKVTDFGMSRAVNPAIRSRKSSSIKGTLDFMAPEALENPPQYNEKLDVFSFGNIVISTLTHEWPNAAHPVKGIENERVILTELERREVHTRLFTDRERELFFRIVELCLEHRPERRPSSLDLVQMMKDIESKLPEIDTPAALCERAMRERDNAISERNDAIRELKEAICQLDVESTQKAEMVKQMETSTIEYRDMVMLKDDIISGKQSVIQNREVLVQVLEAEKTQLENELYEKNDVIRQKDDAIRQKDDALRQKDDEITLSLLKSALRTLDGEPGSEWQTDPVCSSGEFTVSTSTWNDYEVIEIDWPDTAGGITSSADSPSSLLPQSQPMVRPRPVIRDWARLIACQRVIQHREGGGRYSAIAVRSDGSQLAVADGHMVHILDADYQLTKTLGKRGVSFSVNLFGLAFDSKGNILVSDLDQNTVFHLSQQSTLLQSISRCSNQEKFKKPSGVAVDQHGRIFICDSGNHRISVHDETGKPLKLFGSSGDAALQFNCPSDVACSPDNCLYIADTYNSRICVYRCSQRNASCKFERCFRTTYQPTCLAYAAGNYLIVTAMQSDVVMIYTTKGVLVHSFGGSDRFRAPTGVAVDPSGLLYVSDSLNSRIQVF